MLELYGGNLDRSSDPFHSPGCDRDLLQERRDRNFAALAEPDRDSHFTNGVERYVAQIPAASESVSGFALGAKSSVPASGWSLLKDPRGPANDAAVPVTTTVWSERSGLFDGY